MRSWPSIVNHPSPRSLKTLWRRVGLALIPFAWAGTPPALKANGIDRIVPSTAQYSDFFFLEVTSDSPVASLAQTGLNGYYTVDGQRNTSLDINGGTSASATKPSADSVIELDNDANTSAILTLSYGVNADLNRNFLGTRRSFNALAIDVSSVSSGNNGLRLGSGTFTLTLRSGDVTGTSENIINFDHAGDYFFRYDDPGFAGIRFSRIDECILTLVTTTPGTDFRIDGIYRCNIPESSTASLFVVGLAGFCCFAVFRRRFDKNRTDRNTAVT